MMVFIQAILQDPVGFSMIIHVIRGCKIDDFLDYFVFLSSLPKNMLKDNFQSKTFFMG